MFFLGGGKCPNLGVVNTRILGVVNVLLANDSQSDDDDDDAIGSPYQAGASTGGHLVDRFPA